VCKLLASTMPRLAGGIVAASDARQKGPYK
jgi:hypothetical protein